MIPTQETIFAVTKQELTTLNEVLNFIRDSRDKTINKAASSQIARAMIRIYNNKIEIEPSFYPGIKTIEE